MPSTWVILPSARSRQYWAGAGQRRIRAYAADWLIDIASRNQVCALGSNIASQQRKRFELMLQVQIPRLYIGVIEVMVH